MSFPLFLYAPSVVCCAGIGSKSLLKSCIEGRTAGIAPFCCPDTERRFPAGLVDFSGMGCFEGMRESDVQDPLFLKQPTRFERLAGAALARITDEMEVLKLRYGAGRIAVLTGSCDNGSERSLAAHRFYFEHGVFPPGYDLSMQSAASLSAYAASYFGLEGIHAGEATACASSATALVHAAQAIKAGLCDAALVGGTDVVSSAALLGFDSLEALSKKHTNPCSKNRDGVNLGEAAAFFILSKDRPEHRSCAEMLGCGETSDACHMTAPDSSGKGAADAMQAALADAEIEAEKVDYINMHGTGTLLNDAMECAAMASVFAGKTDIPVSSTKPITGHTLGAAGALELALCMELLCGNPDRYLPSHCWDGVRDPSLPELHFSDKYEKAERLDICMSNSFAFGGCNVSIILGRG